MKMHLDRLRAFVGCAKGNGGDGGVGGDVRVRKIVRGFKLITF